MTHRLPNLLEAYELLEVKPKTPLQTHWREAHAGQTLSWLSWQVTMAVTMSQVPLAQDLEAFVGAWHRPSTYIWDVQQGRERKDAWNMTWSGREPSAIIIYIEVLKSLDYNIRFWWRSSVMSLCASLCVFYFSSFLAIWCLDTKCRMWQRHFRYLWILLGRFEILSTLSIRFQGEPSMSSPLRICAALCAEAGWECESSNQSKPTWTIEWSESKYILWSNCCMVNTYIYIYMYVLYVVCIYIYIPIHYVWTIYLNYIRYM